MKSDTDFYVWRLDIDTCGIYLCPPLWTWGQHGAWVRVCSVTLVAQYSIMCFLLIHHFVSAVRHACFFFFWFFSNEVLITLKTHQSVLTWHPELKTPTSVHSPSVFWFLPVTLIWGNLLEFKKWNVWLVNFLPITNDNLLFQYYTQTPFLCFSARMKPPICDLFAISWAGVCFQGSPVLLTPVINKIW